MLPTSWQKMKKEIKFKNFKQMPGFFQTIMFCFFLGGV